MKVTGRRAQAMTFCKEILSVGAKESLPAGALELEIGAPVKGVVWLLVVFFADAEIVELCRVELIALVALAIRPFAVDSAPASSPGVAVTLNGADWAKIPVLLALLSGVLGATRLI